MDREVEPRQSGLWAVVGIATDRAVDELWVIGAKIFEAKPKSIGTAGDEVFDHDVTGGGESARDRDALWIAEVHGDGAFSAVRRHVIGGLATCPGRSPSAGDVAAIGTLDLDDLGAKVRQDHRAVRPG